MPSLALPRPPAAPISSVSWTLSEALDRATYAMAAPLLRQVRSDTGQIDEMELTNSSIFCHWAASSPGWLSYPNGAHSQKSQQRIP